MRIQKIVPVRQELPDRALPDVAAEVHRQMQDASWAACVKRGSRVAVGVGSRGIRNIDVIVKAVVDFWKSREVKPFIVPVMGSHGAATAAGQAEVLARYGVDERSMGAPVESSLDVVPVGTTPQGIAVSMDRLAFESDGVMLCGRVKWHTDFAGALESGIHKMMAIGLGKWEGAKRYHRWALTIGMEQVIRSVGAVVLSTGKMLGGLAILEDAHHNTAGIRALGVSGMAEEEESLLRLVKSWKADIPGAEIDFLIVDEMGKDISGAGMDTKVVNRGGEGANSWMHVPIVHRIFVRDLSRNTHGNAIGMGMADVVHDRLVEKIDYESTWVNALTASAPAPGFTPMHFATDRECIERLLPTCGRADTGECTLAWIRNTLELEHAFVSENLLPQSANDPSVHVLGAPRDLPFDAAGNLVSAFDEIA